MIPALLLVPAAAGVAAFLIRSDPARRTLLILTAILHAALAGLAAAGHGAPTAGAWLGIDAPARLFLGITSALFLAAAVYACGYLRRESRGARLDFQEEFLFSNAPEAVFTGCLLLFLATMTLVILSRDLGLLWVAIEATTLVSAPMIFFHRHHRSLEATWKYLLICSVGIGVALLGNFCLAVAAARGGGGGTPLLLEELLRRAPEMNVPWLKAAFICLLVGYGTKMGLAPLHTWLPDAHSESPSVVSALLSGALLNCAFLGILRAHQVMGAAGLALFSQELLRLFGLVSMGLAGVFLLGQRDFKRALAYSSVEHMGVMALGIGLGGAGIFGSLLHALNHSLAKGMLFLLAGNIIAEYRSKSTTAVRGLAGGLPVTGALWMAGFLAIAGSPPFGLFNSELTILKSAIDGRHIGVAVSFLAFLAMAFVGLTTMFLGMVLGPADPARPARTRPESLVAWGPPAALGVVALLLGLQVPPAFLGLLHAAARVFGGIVMAVDPLRLHNGGAAPRAQLPEVTVPEFREWVIGMTAGGARLAALFGHPLGSGESLQIIGVVADERESSLLLLTTRVGSSFPSLTPDCPQAHLFEREIAEQWGVTPEGHPWLRPVRFQPRRRHGAAAPPPVAAGDTEFFQVAGEEIHEVAVGPVHAGVIEPGHFRFQCHGEQVLHLEISLGYQHRGVERAMVGGPGRRAIHYMETLAGDTTVGHALAWSLITEALGSVRVPARAESLRGVALELERLANHTGDLGALAGDVGFLPTASYCGRIRGDFLNATGLLCGNRLGRGFVRPGGMAFDVDDRMIADLLARLEAAGRDVQSAVALLLDTQSVIARFEETGALTAETCRALGIVGVPARACDLERDVRQDFPAGIYQFFQIPVATWHSGDVLARAHVRAVEIQRSLAFIREQLAALPPGPVRADGLPGGVPRPGPDRVALSLVEGWRGEICHVALTDAAGKLARYKVVDPSFHNWTGLAMAMRNEAISDFPLCNKSFNLSYCGHDL